MDWYSQAGQDQWVVATYPAGFVGYFVEVGAYDGIQTSNTYALEQLGWDGVCIEAHPMVALACERNRQCTVISAAATARAGPVQFEGDRVVAGGGVTIHGDTLTAMLDEAKAPPLIHYMSLDIEGGELDALHGLDFDRFHVNMLSVEHNLYAVGPDYKQALFELLDAHGFERVYEDVECQEEPYLGCKYEDWYFNRRFLAAA